MKILALALALAATVLPSSANSTDPGSQIVIPLTKTVNCTELLPLLTYLKTELGEVPVWGGKNKDVGFILLENSTTKTWTMIEFQSNVACILGMGNDRMTFKQ